jgi:hypothetical protein
MWHWEIRLVKTNLNSMNNKKDLKSESIAQPIYCICTAQTKSQGNSMILSISVTRAGCWAYEQQQVPKNQYLSKLFTPGYTPSFQTNSASFLVLFAQCTGALTIYKPQSTDTLAVG